MAWLVLVFIGTWSRRLLCLAPFFDLPLQGEKNFLNFCTHFCFCRWREMNPGRLRSKRVCCPLLIASRPQYGAFYNLPSTIFSSHFKKREKPLTTANIASSYKAALSQTSLLRPWRTGRVIIILWPPAGVMNFRFSACDTAQSNI